MRVAIPVWEDRISPVFDAARTFLVADIEDGRVTGRRLLLCGSGRQGGGVHLLLEAEVQVLICGAISREPARLIEERGIRLIPFIAGMAEQVLNSYVCGSSITTYRMPGCCGNGSRRGLQCRRLAGHCAVRESEPDEPEKLIGTLTEQRRNSICQDSMEQDQMVKVPPAAGAKAAADSQGRSAAGEDKVAAGE